MAGDVDRHVGQLLEHQKSLFGEVIIRLYLQESSPASTFQCEQELEATGKELMRVLVERTLNHSNRKSPNRHVARVSERLRFGDVLIGGDSGKVNRPFSHSN